MQRKSLILFVIIGLAGQMGDNTAVTPAIEVERCWIRLVRWEKEGRRALADEDSGVCTCERLSERAQRAQKAYKMVGVVGT
jgi:hypothetical protein